MYWDIKPLLVRLGLIYDSKWYNNRPGKPLEIKRFEPELNKACGSPSLFYFSMREMEMFQISLKK